MGSFGDYYGKDPQEFWVCAVCGSGEESLWYVGDFEAYEEMWEGEELKEPMCCPVHWDEELVNLQDQMDDLEMEARYGGM